MLPKENRLTKTKEFDNIFKNGRSNYDKMIGIKLIPNNLNVSRFGLLVSNKISKKAVKRNKIKRQIRNILYKRLDSITPGFDCLIISLPDIREKKFQEIEESIDRHFNRVRLYK